MTSTPSPNTWPPRRRRAPARGPGAGVGPNAADSLGGAAPPVLEALEPHLEAADPAAQEAPVRQAHRSLSRRLDGLDYPRALRLGLPIGSGLIESAHRHVLPARLQQAGAAWLADHADQLAPLRVRRANQRWNAFWD